MKIQDVEFECGCDPLEVTSLHRPDTSWRFVDRRGHEHRWHVNGKPAESYDPQRSYDVPTLMWVKDGETIDEDGEVKEFGHTECCQCCASVTPGYTADTNRCFVPGLRWCRINGESVTPEEFERRLTAAREASGA